MKTLNTMETKHTKLKVSKSGKSFFLNGKQVSNFDQNGIKILPTFLEKLGTIETDCKSVQEFIEKDLPSFVENWNKERTKRMEKTLADIRRWDEAKEKSFKEISQGVIEVNEKNLSIVLNYLNNQNWGSWILPPMSIGYSAHQYDCDGRTASTIILDRPIEIESFGEIVKEKRFKVGGSHGHLENYRRV